MKRLITITALLLTTYAMHAQRTPEAFLGMLPAPPGNVCTAKQAEIDSFKIRIGNIIESLEVEINRLQKGSEDKNEKIARGMSKNLGLSDTQIARLEAGGELSEVEQRKLADQQIQKMSGGDLSMDDIERVSKMSEAEQEKWAAERVAKKQTQMQTDPAKRKQIQDQAAKGRSMAALTQEQKEINLRILERAQKLADFDRIEKTEREKLDRQLADIAREREKVNDGEMSTPADQARIKELERKKYDCLMAFCETMSGHLLQNIRIDLNNTKQSLPDLYRLDVISNEQIRQMSGVAGTLPTGIAGLTAVKGYAVKLQGAYHFNIKIKQF